jgi:AraC-like DNA-binding protein
MKHNIFSTFRLFVFYILTAALTGCSDFLEIEPLETIVLGKYWNEEADVNGVVSGCYSSMQSQEVVSRLMVWGEFRSDNIVGGKNFENDVNIANIFKENINASNTYAKWGDIYNIINREMGMSFSEYVNRLRVQHAARLLDEGRDLSHAELAERSGFSSITSFYRNFKLYAGCSPKEYQNKQKQQQ